MLMRTPKSPNLRGYSHGHHRTTHLGLQAPGAAALSAAGPRPSDLPAAAAVLDDGAGFRLTCDPPKKLEPLLG
jgi:hypothetical protein